MKRKVEVELTALPIALAAGPIEVTGNADDGSPSSSYK